ERQRRAPPRAPARLGGADGDSDCHSVDHQIWNSELGIWHSFLFSDRSTFSRTRALIPNSEFQIAAKSPMPWTFYGWFVFAAAFIAAYFAWVWITSRKNDRRP